MASSTIKSGWLAIALAGAAMAQSGAELDFVSNHTDFRQIRTEWADKIRDEALRMLEQRRVKVEALRTPAEIAARKKYVGERLTAALGGFPERTPLNARTVGVLDGDGYRVERVIFESQPKFYVTANLYVPKSGTAPYPAILFPLGHETPGAKAYDAWQRVLISMAKKGYVCLAWDTLGQGERIQLFDEDLGVSKVRSSTTEHTVLGTQTLLVGESIARYTIWDGMRALDYLASRKEVDATRIGLTGNSGGGTHTAYLAALDGRIAAAAPSCFITTWSRLLQTIGPQDAEQCIPPSIAEGLDHGDFILSFAPKPYMMLTAIRDFFSITGARETHQEAKGIYRALDMEQKMGMMDADDGHGYTLPRRLAAYKFFSRWLQGREDDSGEPQLAVENEEDLWCTPTGQVATSLGGETVFTLNQRRAKELIRARATFQLDDVRRLIAYEKPRGTRRVYSFGKLDREGYQIEKMTYESEPGVRIPALLYTANRSDARKGIVFAHGQGKAAAHPEVEPLVKKGYTVLSIDLRGFGEMRLPGERNGSDWARFFGNYEAAMTAMLSGKSLVAMRAADIAAAVDVLESKVAEVAGLARDGAAIPMLHAAALDGRIKRLGLEGMLVSYETVVNQRINRMVFEHVVRGALRSYDLPDLAASMAPRPVWIAGAVDAMGNAVRGSETQRIYNRGAVKLVRRTAADTTATLFGGLF